MDLCNHHSHSVHSRSWVGERRCKPTLGFTVFSVTPNCDSNHRPHFGSLSILRQFSERPRKRCELGVTTITSSRDQVHGVSRPPLAI
jgi:hypothetical protein